MGERTREGRLTYEASRRRRLASATRREKGLLVDLTDNGEDTNVGAGSSAWRRASLACSETSIMIVGDDANGVDFCSADDDVLVAIAGQKFRLV
jgi:hypothetical protein